MSNATAAAQGDDEMTSQFSFNFNLEPNSLGTSETKPLTAKENGSPFDVVTLGALVVGAVDVLFLIAVVLKKNTKKNGHEQKNDL